MTYCWPPTLPRDHLSNLSIQSIRLKRRFFPTWLSLPPPAANLTLTSSVASADSLSILFRSCRFLWQQSSGCSLQLKSGQFQSKTMWRGGCYKINWKRHVLKQCRTVSGTSAVCYGGWWRPLGGRFCCRWDGLPLLTSGNKKFRGWIHQWWW